MISASLVPDYHHPSSPRDRNLVRTSDDIGDDDDPYYPGFATISSTPASLSEDWISIVRKLFDPPLDNEFREFELFPAANAEAVRLIVRR